MTTLAPISPAEAQALLRQGAALIDIRESDEHAREKIPGARHHALSGLGAAPLTGARDKVVIFHCRSGARTQANAPRLAGAAPGCEAFVLEGGIEGWKQAGLPVATDRRQPLEIMRQVQIAAGSLVLLGVLLGALVAPGFYGLAAFVGAGLLLAGVTGSCLMAKLLSAMPWNRRAAAA